MVIIETEFYANLGIVFLILFALSGFVYSIQIRKLWLKVLKDHHKLETKIMAFAPLTRLEVPKDKLTHTRRMLYKMILFFQSLSNKKSQEYYSTSLNLDDIRKTKDRTLLNLAENVMKYSRLMYFFFSLFLWYILLGFLAGIVYALKFYFG